MERLLPFNINLSLLPLYALALTAVVASPFTALAQETTLPIDDTAVIHEDWQVLCDDEQPCRISQTIAQPNTSRVILQVKVFAGENPTMLLTFPLGILLSPGWSYQIDGGRRTVTPFEICNLSGCHSGVRLDADLVGRLKRGSRLIVSFRDAAKVSDKYTMITDDLVTAQNQAAEAREDGEVEDMFARPRRKIA